MFVCLSNSEGAVDTYWTGTTGDWSSSSNWMYKVPDATDDAYVDNGGLVNITSGTSNAHSLYVGKSIGKSGTIYHSSGTTSIGGLLNVGEYGGQGHFSLAGGTLSSISSYIGYAAGSGVFDHTGGSYTVSNILSIGGEDNGDGTYYL